MVKVPGVLTQHLPEWLQTSLPTHSGNTRDCTCWWELVSQDSFQAHVTSNRHGEGWEMTFSTHPWMPEKPDSLLAFSIAWTVNNGHVNSVEQPRAQEWSLTELLSLCPVCPQAGLLCCLHSIRFSLSLSPTMWPTPFLSCSHSDIFPKKHLFVCFPVPLWLSRALDTDPNLNTAFVLTVGALSSSPAPLSTTSLPGPPLSGIQPPRSLSFLSVLCICIRCSFCQYPFWQPPAPSPSELLIIRQLFSSNINPVSPAQQIRSRLVLETLIIPWIWPLKQLSGLWFYIDVITL